MGEVTIFSFLIVKSMVDPSSFIVLNKSSVRRNHLGKGKSNIHWIEVGLYHSLRIRKIEFLFWVCFLFFVRGCVGNRKLDI